MFATRNKYQGARSRFLRPLGKNCFLESLRFQTPSDAKSIGGAVKCSAQGLSLFGIKFIRMFNGHKFRFEHYLVY